MTRRTLRYVAGITRLISLVVVVVVILADTCAAFKTKQPHRRVVSHSSSGRNNQRTLLSTPTKFSQLGSSISSTSSSSTQRNQRPLIPPFISQRVQRVKDISLQKEIIKDVTACEFALQLEVKTSKDNAKIDYEMLIMKLKEHLEVLQNPMRIEISGSKDADTGLIDRIEETKDKLMKRTLETTTATTATTTNKVSTDSLLQAVASGAASGASGSKSKTVNDWKDALDTAPVSDLKEALDTKRVRELKESLRVIVREDGSVDWDGATAAGKEVAKFGAELWERLNGKEEGIPSFSELIMPVQAKEHVTEQTIRLSQAVTNVKEALAVSITDRDALKAKLRQERKDGRMISADDIQTLKRADSRVSECEKRVRIFTLDLDIERVCVYLQQELEQSVEPTDLRVLVAEVALIEKQFLSLISGLVLAGDTSLSSSSADIATSQGGLDESGGNGSPADLVSLVDVDELTLLCREVEDLKSRLGLGTQAAVGFDWGTLGVVSVSSLAKFREGLSFYGEGTKILFSDLEYASVLIIKAIQGYILKPREVNAIRRTGKDLLTLIPFTIILIIPLSPVGHVLVFSFIQRFFPDFFPSCYTEKRLNLRKLYAEIERKSDVDILGEDENTSFPVFQPLANLFEGMGKNVEKLLAMKSETTEP